MKQPTAVKALCVALLLIGVCGASFFLGDRHAAEGMTIKRVAPAQVANAMKGDYFYSTYGENTLLVTGTVESVARSGKDLTVTFKADSSYKAVCSFENYTRPIHGGQTITALSEAATAQRQPAGILLRGCVIP